MGDDFFGGHSGTREPSTAPINSPLAWISLALMNGADSVGPGCGAYTRAGGAGTTVQGALMRGDSDVSCRLPGPVFLTTACGSPLRCVARQRFQQPEGSYRRTEIIGTAVMVGDNPQPICSGLRTPPCRPDVEILPAIALAKSLDLSWNGRIFFLTETRTFRTGSARQRLWRGNSGTVTKPNVSAEWAPGVRRGRAKRTGG